ncbi:uncharacterized protein ARMOST_17791 [Armillaria ostoyae]|uniref:Uncharacterized protein n=1 Tax=Armillaria ostoyae TaxID=47428 RepID=A0A284S005_ARMOS|nr:uncharacterized protein ARMOST_17791 [Armillaria ostoyae]
MTRHEDNFGGRNWVGTWEEHCAATPFIMDNIKIANPSHRSNEERRLQRREHQTVRKEHDVLGAALLLTIAYEVLWPESSQESSRSERYTPPVHRPQQHRPVYQSPPRQPPPLQSYPSSPYTPSPHRPPKYEDDNQKDQPNEYYLVLRARANNEGDEIERCFNESREAKWPVPANSLLNPVNLPSCAKMAGPYELPPNSRQPPFMQEVARPYTPSAIYPTSLTATRPSTLDLPYLHPG